MAVEREALGHRLHEALRIVGPVPVVDTALGDPAFVEPERLAVRAIDAAHRPARQLLSRIPLSLAVEDRTARRPASLQAAEQAVGDLFLPAADRFGVPLRRVGLLDADEGRLATDAQPDVAGLDLRVDRVAEREDPRPFLVGVGLRHARPVDDARDLHLDVEVRLDLLDPAADRRRRTGRRRRRERDVSLGGQQPGGRIEADPPGARHIAFAPRVEVGEVLLRALRPLERHLVRSELDQVAGDEAARDAAAPQHLREQPRRVPARAASELERLLRCLHTRLHPDHVLDRLLHRAVRLDEEVVRLARPQVERGEEALEAGRRRQAREVGLEVGQCVRVVAERPLARGLLEEVVERAVRLEVRHQIDVDPEVVGLLGDDDPREVVAERILLPVHEVVGRLDPHRVAVDRRPVVGRRPQAHRLRPEGHPAGVAVVRRMSERDPDRHRRPPVEALPSSTGRASARRRL